MRVITFNPESSSLNKNETFYDTIRTFDSLGVDALVIRHGENEYYNQLVGRVKAPILNGGDGTGNHPTQSLLDLLTIRQEFGRLEGLKVAIVGDIKHSRVAHTNYEVMRRLGMETVISGPEMFLDPEYETEAFDTAVATADVVMMLRVQYERHAGKDTMSQAEYHERFGLTSARVRTMRDRSIIMHPAPVNRGVEIADEIVECEKSRIFKQMENGVYVRMAALHWATEGAVYGAYDAATQWKGYLRPVV